MPKLLDVAGTLDFDSWLKGLVGAAISGAASAVSGAVVLPSLDSIQFNIFKSHFWIAVVALGGSSGLVSLMKFLSTEPLPPTRIVTTKTETVTGIASKPIVTKTVEEVHTETVGEKPGVRPKES